MNVTLDAIIANKRKEVAEKQSSQDEIATSPAAPRNDKRDFIHALKHSSLSVALIGEIKLASPTEGVLGSGSSVRTRARAYENAGIAAISVVVDEAFFNGDIGLIQQAKQATSLPVLAKEFVIDEYQIHELASAHADAILLIAKILDDTKLASCIDIIRQYGIDPVVEVQNDGELQRVLPYAQIIAVNARNLTDFSVNVKEASLLLQKIPRKITRLGFSGIHTKEDVLQYKKAGANGVLVGTSLMKARNIDQFVKELL